MVGLAKNKRSKVTVSTDDSLPLLDSPRCVIALVSGGDRYDEMMEKINVDENVCWIEYILCGCSSCFYG